MDPDNIKINPFDEDKTSTASKTTAQALELPNKESFRCPNHPQYKIDSLCCNEETEDVRLCCVKCIVEQKLVFLNHEKYRTITIKDFFEKALEKSEFGQGLEYQSESRIRQKYLEFLTKDYKVQYNTHMNEQYQLLAHAIEEIISGLNQVKERVKHHAATQITEIDMRIDEVTRETKRFIENDDGIDIPPYNSLEEIYEHLGKVENWEQTCRFFKEIYSKTKAKISGDDPAMTGGRAIIHLIDNFEDKFNKLLSKKIDLSYFEEGIMNDVQLLLREDTSLFTGGGTSNSKVEKRPNPDFQLNLPPVTPSESDYNERSQMMKSEFMDIAYSPSQRDENTYFPAEYNRPSGNSFNPNGGMRKSKKLLQRLDSTALRGLKSYFRNYQNNGEVMEEEDLGIESKKENKTPQELLKDWINRRITGYLVFRNTNCLEKGEKGVKREASDGTTEHLNKSMGAMWKGLSEKEKGIYLKIANHYRKLFKGQVDNLEDISKFGDLLDYFDETSKKIKKT